MTRKVSIGVQIVDGRIELDRRLFLRLVQQMPNGDAVLTLSERGRQRSVDQNAYLHAGPLPVLADYFGLSVEETKYALMGEKWGWTRSPINGREVPVKPSTSSMTVEECSEFIDWLIAWALEKFNVTLPLPSDVAA